MPPLAKQTIDIPFGGLETKLDPKLVPLGRSLVLENAEFDKAAAISKRNGYVPLTNATITGGTITSGKQLLRSQGRLLLDDGAGSLFEYSQAAAKWKALSSSYMSGVVREKRIPAVLGAASAHDVDVAVANGVALYSWTINGSGVYYALVDIATDTPLYVASTSLAGFGSVSSARVAAVGKYLVIAAIDSTGNLKAYIIDATTPSTYSSPSLVTIATDAVVTGAARGPMDMGVIPSSFQVAIAYKTNTPQIKVVLYDVSIHSVIHGPVAIVTTPASQIGVTTTARGDTWVAWRDSANDLKQQIYDNALLAIGGAASIETDATIDSPVGIEDPTTADVINWAYNTHVTTGGVTYRKMRRVGRSRSGAETHLGDIAFGVNCATRPFIRNGKLLIAGHYRAASVGGPITQATYLVFDYFSAATSTVPANPVGRILPGQAVDDSVADIQPSSVQVLDVSTLVCGMAGVEIQDEVVDSIHGFTTMVDLAVPFAVEFDFGAKSTYADLGAGALISGMQCWSLEGDIVPGNNFHVAPEIISAVGSAGSGSLSDGSYEVAAVFMRIDKLGQVHFSGTSIPSLVVLSGGTSTQKISVKVGGIHYEPGSYVLLYVTGNGLSTFYEIIATNTLIYDHAVSGVITTVPTSNREIYTTGGILDNGAAPSFTSIVKRGKRIYGITPDGVLWYTKEHIQGEAAAFVPETLVEQLLPDNGQDYGLVEMDDNIIVLGENSVQVVTGDGLNDTGLAGGLSEPRQVAIDAGRVAFSSYVRTSIGIMFLSARGIYLLGRSLDVQYIGRPVDQFAVSSLDFGPVILYSAVLVPNRTEVRFGVNGPLGERTLVYDYSEQTWSSFTGLSQFDAVVWQDAHAWLSPDGIVHQQDTGFVDDATPIVMAVDSPWIKVDALQGYLKTFYLSVLGTWRSPHSLLITLYYDYNDTVAETFIFDASTGYSAGDPIQVRHYVGRKCQSLKVRIEDSDQDDTMESLSLTGISLELGGLGGTFRQAPAKTV